MRQSSHEPESDSELPPPPRTGVALQDQVVTVGDLRLAVEVHGGFEGSPTVFDAVSNDESLVTVQPLGSAIGIAGLAEGVTTVTVRAWNSAGCAHQTIGVTVVDPASE